MPSWKASALAEFRVTVLGTSAHWTVDLKLYLETFEGYTNGIVQIFEAGWFAVVGGGGLGEGGSRDPQRKAVVFPPPPTSFWAVGVSMSCVSNAPLHNFCNS